MPVTCLTVRLLIWNNHLQPCPTLRSSAPSLLVLEQPPGTGLGWGARAHGCASANSSALEDRQLQAPPGKLKQKKKPLISLLPHLKTLRQGWPTLRSEFGKRNKPPRQIPFSTPQHCCASHPSKLKRPPQLEMQSSAKKPWIKQRKLLEKVYSLPTSCAKTTASVFKAALLQKT